MPELIEPTARLAASWRAARDDWGRGVHQDGSGLNDDADDVDTDAGFAAWVARLRQQADDSVPVAPDRVHASYWWIVSGDEILGAISLRHELNDFLLRAGGHIGYGVRPSARRRGLAGWTLVAVLDRARDRGMDRVLITCADDNVASARTIERAGGVLDDVRDTELGRTRRYWITLSDSESALSTAD
ncbi:GNAT family N-acetyltransferase [Actinocatenispora sera]|uniref:Acetyltransferase n=1 Tax=Actinocatenispora sera TaxID=390989 RepID=A0A810KWV1_9ACTN|nr:GNAT family N-acetyltransferase [Actinocatenispora sera]BCJ26912.1 acetyltransferase [Actinocatenispora sera]